MPHTFTNLLTHLIFSTRERAPLIDADLKPKLHAYMGGIVRELKGRPLFINGTADHVHLLVVLPPAVSTSDALRLIKTNSSRWAHDVRRKPFGWQTGYGAFSVSESNAQAVGRYIANQEAHHRRVSFQEEFVAFLRRHRMEFDERAIWD
jgi:putative transposase